MASILEKKSKLSAEEELELRHLQSVVQAYFDEPNALVEELQMLKRHYGSIHQR